MNALKMALVVDDEVQLLRLVVRVLERAGWKARTAETVDEALAVFRDHADEIDLALLDVNLSEPGGAAELLPSLLELRPSLRVLVMSGDTLPEALSEELAAVGGGFLRKPFVPKALMRILEDIGRQDADASELESA